MDWWCVILLVSVFLNGFLITENYKLKKFKVKYIELANQYIRNQRSYFNNVVK